jgi:DNA-nicking Smr family endonuclease
VPRERRPTPDELALWQRAMEGQPLDRDMAVSSPPAAATTTPKAERGGVRVGGRSTGALDPTRPVDLDRRSWLRLKRGRVAIEAKLDLHGMTQERAHRALTSFLTEVQAAGRRTVLVVTGKGLEQGGILRSMVPRWLGETGNRERVVAFCPAQPRHGGSGALYVLIRRAGRGG